MEHVYRQTEMFRNKYTHLKKGGSLLHGVSVTGAGGFVCPENNETLSFLAIFGFPASIFFPCFS